VLGRISHEIHDVQPGGWGLALPCKGFGNAEMSWHAMERMTFIESNGVEAGRESRDGCSQSGKGLT